MKQLTHFSATGVFSHLEMDIDFFSNLTFLHGLNGSGKTTALKLMMGLLEPSIEALVELDFKQASIAGVSHEFGPIEIRATKTESSLLLECSVCPEAPLELNLERVEEGVVERALVRNSTFNLIQGISNPIFLPVERRLSDSSLRRTFYGGGSQAQSPGRSRRAGSFEHKGHVDHGLAQATKLINRKLSAIRAARDGINEKFREELLLESFPYVDRDTDRFSFGTPSEKEFKEFRVKRIAISNALRELDLETEGFEERSTSFFDAMEEIIGKIRKAQDEVPGDDGQDAERYKDLTTWFVNQSQLYQIDRLFKITSKFQGYARKAQGPMDGFLLLVNAFFSQTGKSVVVRRGKGVEIQLPNKGGTTSLQHLSSGERQIFIILSHLTFNKNLRREGVFIVDEPEISLHLSWQEMFVKAIQEASPGLQIILATHAPSIIGGRNEFCVPVSIAHLS